MKKILLTLILGMFLISLVCATDLIFQFNEKIDLKRPCFNNGSFCSGSAVCNITVLYPDGESLLNNQLMTNQISFHNITILQSLNNQLGIHQAIMSCNDGGLYGSDTFEIDITADGKEYQVFPTEFIFLILGFLFIGFGIVSERCRIFKHLGSILIMIIGVITLYPGYSFINWTTLLGKGVGFLCIGIGFYFLIEDSFSRDEQQERYESEPKEFLDDGRFHG